MVVVKARTLEHLFLSLTGTLQPPNLALACRGSTPSVARGTCRKDSRRKVEVVQMCQMYTSPNNRKRACLNPK